MNRQKEVRTEPHRRLSRLIVLILNAVTQVQRNTSYRGAAVQCNGANNIHVSSHNNSFMYSLDLAEIDLV